MTLGSATGRRPSVGGELSRGVHKKMCFRKLPVTGVLTTRQSPSTCYSLQVTRKVVNWLSEKANSRIIDGMGYFIRFITLIDPSPSVSMYTETRIFYKDALLTETDTTTLRSLSLNADSLIGVKCPSGFSEPCWMTDAGEMFIA